MSAFRESNSPQRNLWERSCGACPLFQQCGGSKTAPCGCVRTGSDYRNCRTCSVNCVERIVKEGDTIVESFESQLREGLPLNALRIAQPLDLGFPSLLLSRTESLPRTEVLEDKGVAVHMRTLTSLFRNRRSPRRTAETLRRNLRVNPETQLVGVLSGTDDLLELLWSFDRTRVFEVLQQVGINVITGPTFSLYGEGPLVPASHNITMLQRHHRFCAEAFEAGLVVLPNVYWRNAKDAALWAKWLADNRDVLWISRDFSRTKQWACFEPELSGLTDLICGASRPVNVMLIGVGGDKMAATRARLNDVGSDCTFVTSRPVVAPPVLSAGQTRLAGIKESISAYRSMAGDMRPFQF